MSWKKFSKEYTEHYHFEKNHQGVSNRLIDGQRSRINMSGGIERCESLGGLLNYYRRGAWLFGRVLAPYGVGSEPENRCRLK